MLVKTFDPTLDSNRELVEKLSIKCKEISQSDDHLAPNYGPDHFSLMDQIAISIVLNSTDDIIMFATLWDRKDFYNNCVRTMNRLWKAPSIRKGGLWRDAKKRKDFYGPEIINQHIAIAREKNINQLFISRESGAHRYLKYISKTLNEKTGLNWIAPKEMYLVCPADNLKCWHNVLYTNVFRDEPLHLKTNGLTYEEMLRNKYYYGHKRSS